jgi:hypothetical protein
MTRKLEELFELSESDILDNDDFKNGIAALTELHAQLPSADITDLSTSDIEMDELAAKAVNHYDQLMDLGMNVEPRFSAPIFDAASKMLGHAITAKTSKIDKKLKALDLELKRRRLELQERQAKEPDEVEEGHAREIDRNSLLEMLRNKKQDKSHD